MWPRLPVSDNGEVMVNRPDSSPSASWRRLLLLPTAARLGAQAPRDHRVGWDLYWREVELTGDGGDVLWDTSNPGEIAQYLPILLRYLDPELPIVDIGCGNGRQARILSEHFSAVLGVDLSATAITRAQQESAGIDHLRFETLDLTAPGAGAHLVETLGEANIFVRGVFHVLAPKAQLQMVGNLRKILGARGRLFLAETNYPGDALSYLRHLGARAGRMPMPLRRAIQRLPRPRHFGAAEREKCLPKAEWIVLDDGVTAIYTIPMRHNAGSEVIPGYYAALTPRNSQPVS
jgi:SAM-dependent methyltransferase